MYFEEIEIELNLSNNDRYPYNYDSLVVLVSGNVITGDTPNYMPEIDVTDLTVFSIMKDDEVEIKYDDLNEDHKEIVMQRAEEAIANAYEEASIDFYSEDDTGVL